MYIQPTCLKTMVVELNELTTDSTSCRPEHGTSMYQYSYPQKHTNLMRLAAGKQKMAPSTSVDIQKWDSFGSCCI